MTIFLDTANISEIERCFKLGIIKGITTNPKICSKEPKMNFKHMRKICEIVFPLPVSVELTKVNGTICELIDEGNQLTKLAGNIVVKVPMWKDNKAFAIASELDASINFTCCMNVSQAILACEFGAKYVSLFYRRIVDFHKHDNSIINHDFGLEIIRRTRQIIDQQGYTTKIIAGSIRKPWDVADCLLAGAHIVTISPKILEQLSFHEKTEETIAEFDAAWLTFLKK